MQTTAQYAFERCVLNAIKTRASARTLYIKHERTRRLSEALLKDFHVVVGLLCNDKNEVLIALRPPHVPHPGVWEFPGGKVEPNETLENALVREFQEEIGITVTRAEFFLEIRKPSPEKHILLILHTFQILEFQGEPHGRENQEIRWVPKNTLSNYTFPEANADIVRALLRFPDEI